MRPDGRAPEDIRKPRITRHFTDYAPGSVFLEAGRTRILATAMIDETVPPWLAPNAGGWITAEYGMLPSSTPDRKPRERSRIDGRSQEIQRLIGRALRVVTDLSLLGELTVRVDSDVVQADGSTRCWAVTAAWIALADAVEYLVGARRLRRTPLLGNVAAVSLGIKKGEILVDMNYEEDSTAEADVNLVMTSAGDIVEIQGTSERKPFAPDVLSELVTIGGRAIDEIVKLQDESLKPRPID